MSTNVFALASRTPARSVGICRSASSRTRSRADPPSRSTVVFATAEAPPSSVADVERAARSIAVAGVAPSADARRRNARAVDRNMRAWTCGRPTDIVGGDGGTARVL